METAYTFITRFADFLLRKKRPLFILGGLTVLGAITAVAMGVLQKFPNSADEYLYLYQARTFLAGRFWYPAHPFQDFFEFAWLVNKNGRVFSQYPPGWPLVLAAGMFLKIPACLIGPLTGTLSLGALFLLGKKVYGPRIALLAAGLTFFTSFFVFNSASYFSHTFCSLILILFVYSSLNFEDTLKSRDAAFSGFLFAVAFITRPLSALLCGLLVFLHLLPGLRKAPRKLLPFLAGMLPVLAFLLFYDASLTGNPFLLPMLLFKQNQAWGTNFVQIRRLIEYLKSLFEWMPASFPILYFFYVFREFLPGRKSSSRHLLMGSFFILQIAGYFFYGQYAGNGYGPRYYYEVFPFLVLFITGSLFNENTGSQKSLPGKILFLLFLISLPLSAPQWVAHFKTERAVILERTDLYRSVERQGIKNAIIFIRYGIGTIRPMWVFDLVRNDPGYQNSVLYARDLGRRNEKLMRFYPEKIYYRYIYNKVLRQGSFTGIFPGSRPYSGNSYTNTLPPRKFRPV